MNSDILNNFQKIDILELSTESALMNRLEIKYPINNEYIWDALNIICKNNFKLVTINWKVRQQYKNTYYDTTNLDFFKTWEWWIKVRVREYETWELFLEIKEKKYWRTTKTRELIHYIPETYQYHTLNLYRVLQNWYNRYSFINTELNVRITLDLDIYYSYFKDNINTMFVNSTVIEIKWLKKNIEVIKKEFYNFNRVNFSKYKHWVRFFLKSRSSQNFQGSNQFPIL